MNMTRFYGQTRRMRLVVFFPSVVAHPKSVQTSLETRLRKIIQLTVSVTVLLLIARREASSETQGLLAGTMRYFYAKVYFKS